jgi:type II secretory pathway pseudopilin PulG
MRKDQRAFSLIEIMVIISIIGLLTSAILASLTDAREEARYTRARIDIKTIATAISAARFQSNKTPLQITGSVSTEQSCRNKGNIQNLPKSDSCWINYISAISSISAATKNAYIISNAPTDP